MARKLTFTHPRTGETFNRTTDADYTHVSIKHGEIKWHQTRTAAQRRGGEIYPVSPSGATPAPAELFQDRREGPSGNKGCTVSTGAGQQCGKPAVKSWTTRSGETFHECREHAL